MKSTEKIVKFTADSVATFMQSLNDKFGINDVSINMAQNNDGGKKYLNLKVSFPTEKLL